MKKIILKESKEINSSEPDPKLVKSTDRLQNSMQEQMLNDARTAIQAMKGVGFNSVREMAAEIGSSIAQAKADDRWGAKSIFGTDAVMGIGKTVAQALADQKGSIFGADKTLGIFAGESAIDSIKGTLGRIANEKSIFGQVDKTAKIFENNSALGLTSVIDYTKALGIQTAKDMISPMGRLSNEFKGFAAQEPFLKSFKEQIIPDYEKMLADKKALISAPYKSAIERYCEPLNPYKNFEDEMSKSLDFLKPRENFLRREMDPIFPLRESFDRNPARYETPAPRQINLAKIIIEDVMAEKAGLEEELPFGKILKLYVVMGKREILAETLQAVNPTTIKVEGVDQNGKFIIGKSKVDDFSYFFQEDEISHDNLKNIH